jgi:hypothetical protein
MKRNILTIILILPLLIVALGCGGGGGGLKILEQSLTVHEFSGGGPESVAIVHGRAQNVNNSSIENATISVNFYDKNNKLIASGSTVKENLLPGETWDFSVQTVSPDAWKIVTYDIATGKK